MDWLAITWSGFIATTLAAAFFAVVRSFGWSRFSPAVQLGCIFFKDARSPLTETVGFVLFVLLGSTLIPALYALAFGVTAGPGWLAGVVLGTLHGLVVAAALPVLGTISACVRAGSEPPPGWFGIEWGWRTPVGVVGGHSLYGAVTGTALASF